MTDVALKEYLDRRIDDLDKRIDRRFLDMERQHDQRFAATEVAGTKADAALREYKTGSNEWRDALKDANNRMATRAELEKLDEVVQSLQRAKANLDGRLVVLAGSVSLAVSVLLWALTHFVK
jgi:hypothetical protein